MTSGASGSPPVVVLSGGIGGAKLALGLHRVIDAGALGVVANVGDDFVHLGLSICPDIDTLLYTLAGLADPVRGWGRRERSTRALDSPMARRSRIICRLSSPGTKYGEDITTSFFAARITSNRL